MKKILLIISFMFCFLYSKEQKLIEGNLVQNFYPKLDTNFCDSSCLLELLETRMYLSFLSEFADNKDKFLLNIYSKLLNSITDFETNLQKITSVKIAIIVPEKTIKSYSNTIINASIAYLLKQRAEIKVKVFLIGTEDEAKIKQTLSQIENQNYKYLIAGFTLKGVNALNDYKGNLKIFIPTIHKNNTNINNENIYFGSIDYNEQIKKLLEYSNSNIAIFSDNSTLSNNLNTQILKQNEQARIYKIEGDKLDFAKLFKSQGGLNDASIFFNTPLIKTALSSSQLRFYDIHPFVLLSTQINYNPVFLSLTQPNDRKNFIIANSINNNDDSFSYLNEIFNQNIDYNWIAYATSVGIDYFYTKFLNPKSERIFEEKLENSQFIYKIKLVKGLKSNFEELH